MFSISVSLMRVPLEKPRIVIGLAVVFLADVSVLPKLSCVDVGQEEHVFILIIQYLYY